LDTSQASNGQVPLSFTFPLPWLSSTAAFLLVGLSAGFLFLTLTLYLVTLEFKPARPVKYKKGYWLRYALPMVAVWGFFLLIFFPGFVPEDSIMQWGQVVSGQYNDAHPLFYTLLIGLLINVRYSPSSIVLVQIAMVSVSLAWGLSELEHMGVSRKLLWCLVFLFAFLPINIISTITLRKDVPYSAALLVLSIIFLKLIKSRGEWLKEQCNWLGLGSVLGIICLTRINGLPVAFGSLIIFFIVYRQFWRRLAAATGVLAIMLAAMYGPVYSLLRVKHVPEFGAVLFLHHIAAHIQEGTFLTPEQQEYLGRIAPLNGWDYSCCQVNPTMMAIFPGIVQQNFDLHLLKQDIQKPTRIALDLLLKKPIVDLRHMVCAGQLVWSLNSTCPDRIVLSLEPLSSEKDPIDSFNIQSNELGLKANSKFPGLIQFANPYLQVFSKGLIHWINYTMAIYLYLAIYCTALLAFQKKQSILLLFLAPILIQSVTLFLINISQTYRYQYGVVLVGLLSIGLLFVPLEKKGCEFPRPSETNSSGVNY